MIGRFLCWADHHKFGADDANGVTTCERGCGMQTARIVHVDPEEHIREIARAVAREEIAAYDHRGAELLRTEYPLPGND